MKACVIGAGHSAPAVTCSGFKSKWFLFGRPRPTVSATQLVPTGQARCNKVVDCLHCDCRRYPSPVSAGWIEQRRKRLLTSVTDTRLEFPHVVAGLEALQSHD